MGLNRGRIDEPASCAECHNKGSMELILNRSVYLNKQVIRMQVRNQPGGMGYPQSSLRPTFLRPIGAELELPQLTLHRLVLVNMSAGDA